MSGGSCAIRCGKMIAQGFCHQAIKTCATVITTALVGFHHVYFDRTNLPDIESFTRFEFPTIGHVYDVNGRPLIELAREYRRIINRNFLLCKMSEGSRCGRE